MQLLGIYSGGALYRHEHLASRHVAPRHVDVWCPPGYEAGARYPAIYMHDGQNLFEPALSTFGVPWGVDEALARLVAEGAIAGAIVVGIWSTPERRREYMPERPLLAPEARALRDRFSREQGGPPMSDAYLRFLVEELKPLIDATYHTLPDRAHTFVMGSSMGGLISLYALIEYPEIFGGAAGLSTHWPAGEEALVDSLGASLPKASRHRLYFDFGTETLEAAYEPYQQRMDGWVQAAGYRFGHDWLTRRFAGAEHSERAWRARVDIPLRFLLGAEVAAS